MPRGDASAYARRLAGILGGAFDPRRLRQLPVAIRDVLQDERSDPLVIGMRLKEEINANLKIFAGNTTHPLEERALLADYSAKLYGVGEIAKMRVE